MATKSKIDSFGICCVVGWKFGIFLNSNINSKLSRRVRKKKKRLLDQLNHYIGGPDVLATRNTDSPEF